MTTFASSHLDDLLAHVDPLDVYTDMLHLNRLGHWKYDVPEWCEMLADQLGTSPAMIISGIIFPWLLDQAVDGALAGAMFSIRQAARDEYGES